MAPKLHAHTSQIFKASAYELKYGAYGFCLNKQQANLLYYLGVIFSKPEKIITYLRFARTQRRLHSECIKNTTVDARHLSLFYMFLWCSFTNNASSHGINKRDQNNNKSVSNIDFSLKVQDQWRHHISRNGYLPDWRTGLSALKSVFRFHVVRPEIQKSKSRFPNRIRRPFYL